jgi:hypothetical protein
MPTAGTQDGMPRRLPEGSRRAVCNSRENYFFAFFAVFFADFLADFFADFLADFFADFLAFFVAMMRFSFENQR